MSFPEIMEELVTFFMVHWYLLIVILVVIQVVYMLIRKLIYTKKKAHDSNQTYSEASDKLKAQSGRKVKGSIMTEAKIIAKRTANYYYEKNKDGTSTDKIDDYAFYVMFELEGGLQREFRVQLDEFDKMCKNQIGKLTYKDDMFLAFFVIEEVTASAN